MLLVRTGGIFGVIVSLIVAGIFLFVVRPAINDTTDRAFDTADRIIDTTDQQIDDTQRQVREATGDLGIDGDYLAAANFAAAVGDIKAELGDDAAAKLTAAVEQKAGAGFDIQSMTLGMTPVTGEIKWTVTGEGDGRQQVFQAAADASGLKKIS